ncbi:MAG: AmmeMemoRadiSam system protein A [Proteobacteria bacterium]|nr:AmmeMemoRadiSam system protein A [Pseudomonadota bacterium]
MRALPIQQQRELLRLARHTLERFLAAGEAPSIAVEDPLLLQPAGAFVSLYRRSPKHELRGCIGTFDARLPLVENVARMAIAAATCDPRFPAVEPTELPLLSLEISALAPPRPTSAEAVSVGLHGLQVARGGRRGVFLPQVATAQGWDREAFLAATCRKAGLPADAWRQPQTVIESFTAQVFSEADDLPR